MPSLLRTCSSAIALAVVALAAWQTAHGDDDGRGFRLRVARSVEVRAGTSGTISLTILPKTGYVISRDGPIRVHLRPPQGLEVRKTHLQRRDAVDPRAEAPRFELRVLAKTVGSHRLPVRVRFWVCRKKTCRPIERELEIAVTVPPETPDAGPEADGGPP